MVRVGWGSGPCTPRGQFSTGKLKIGIQKLTDMRKDLCLSWGPQKFRASCKRALHVEGVVSEAPAWQR